MIWISQEAFLIIYIILSIFNFIGVYLYTIHSMTRQDRNWYYFTGILPFVNIFVFILILYNYLVRFYKEGTIEIYKSSKWYYNI